LRLFFAIGENTTPGILVGNNVGSKVGSDNGISLGSDDGNVVNIDVGSVLKYDDGKILRTNDGVALPREVGKAVRLALGIELGNDDEIILSRCDGETVGLEVLVEEGKILGKEVLKNVENT